MCDHCDDVEADNERLRNTVHVLLSAQRGLLDAIGEWTYPTIPNN